MKFNVLPPVQEKLLAIFLSRPQERLYTNELIRLTQEYPNAVQYALNSLSKFGFLNNEVKGKKKFYQLKLSNPIIDEIKEIFRKKGLLDSSTSHLPQKNLWIKLLNREASLAFQVEVPLVNRDYLPKVIDFQINNFWYNGITYGVYYKEEELRNSANAIQLRIKKDSNFAKENIDGCYKLGDKLLNASNIKNVQILRNLSTKELLILLEQFRTAYLNFMPYLLYPHSIERYFLVQIEQELKDILNRKNTPHQFDEYFQILTTPTMHEIEQQIDMLQLAYQVQKYGWSKQVKNGLKQLHQKYTWLPLWTVAAGPLEESYFKDAVEALSKSEKHLLQEVDRIKSEQEKRIKKLKQSLKSLHAPKNLADLVDLLQAYMFLRTYRKNIISKAHYLHLPLVVEIGRRMKIGHDITLVSYEEMIDFLKEGMNISKITLAKRKQGWAVIAFNGVIKIISGDDEVLEVMEQFQIGNNPIPEPTHQVLNGRPACRGRVIGKVKIIKHLRELSKLEKGDVLVTRMTTPDFVPSLGKISAIVTDEGGVTCHAAIVSREFGIPCIVGTGNATQILRDADEVEVNANDGVVTILSSGGVTLTEDVIKGIRLYKGCVKGEVINIKSESDLKRINSDSIVLANTMNPRFLSALYRARGFVVDEYSPTSHAYLYAQTIKIPSLGGTKNASEILKTGDKIELDADKEQLRLL